ncbi:bestrophin family protein [[Phormidium] sp. ETS-05]|uniref:bestrophin family protein n=1 Tax=[Phormidium] sp. ETS-05 TaxID=222819 RepID=UPI0018EED4D9|nr:bestrophin family ion channel [[Phormidium] sp. ETS-05]
MRRKFTKLPKDEWLNQALRLKGSVLPNILPRIILCGLFGVLISILHNFDIKVHWPILSNLVPSLVLGLLLVFRTNTAYDRFWEGRKLWGTLVNTVRNFARQIWVAIREKRPEDINEKMETIRLLVAFAVATKIHLRQEQISPELTDLLSAERAEKLKSMNHPSLEIAFWIGDYLQRQHEEGNLSTYQLSDMFKLLDTMVDVLGACERILKTPIPLAYSIHIKQLLLIYCLALPFQMVENLNWFTGPVVALISFALFGIEAIGLEIENPFGRDPNDLPLDNICNTMLRNIEDLMSFAPSVHQSIRPPEKSMG